MSCPLVADAAVIGIYDDSQATELPLAFSELCYMSLAERQADLFDSLCVLINVQSRSRPRSQGFERPGSHQEGGRVRPIKSRAAQAFARRRARHRGHSEIVSGLAPFLRTFLDRLVRSDHLFTWLFFCSPYRPSGKILRKDLRTLVAKESQNKAKM